jgi:hypothetical protein
MKRNKIWLKTYRKYVDSIVERVETFLVEMFRPDQKILRDIAMKL